VSVSRKEQVYADLRQRVLTLDLAPGLALDEVALSEHYGPIARLAAEHASAAQITELKKIQTRFRKAVDRDRAADMAMHNHRFHEFIGEMAASPYLAPSLDRLLIDHTRMSHRFYRIKKAASKKRVLEAALQHDAMIDAFAQQQPAQAVELTLAHWELSRTEMDKYVMPDPLPTDAAIPAV